MKPNPCYRCPERTVEPNCHDACGRYLEWVAENENIKKERRKDFNYYEYKEKAIQKKRKLGEK